MLTSIMQITEKAFQHLEIISSPWYLKQDFQQHSSADQVVPSRSLHCPKHEIVTGV
jgi:hypothetical protein